jgi:hypothetical protein
MNQPTLNHQTNLPYDCLIENHIKHLSEHDRLWTDVTPPQFWFLTATFIPIGSKRDDHVPIPPHRCFPLFEQFYVRILPRLMSNFERKRHLQPLTYAYIDYPFSKREKAFATLSPPEQFRFNPFHFHPEHPETTPHIHAVMLVPPTLIDRFKTIVPQLENLFERLGLANRTLHAAQLQTTDELRDVMFYSSKLLKQPSSVLRGLSKKYWEPRKIPDEARRSVYDIDLYNVLPKAKSEPIYVKSNWERDELAEIKEAKRFKGLKQAKFGSIEAGTIVRSKTDLKP